VDFSQFTTAREAFSVNFLAGKRVESACMLGDKATKDNFLNIGSLFYNREYLSRKQ